MSFGFSVGDVIAVGTLCQKIYSRCDSARGEFKDLSIKAFNLHGILTTIENGWRAQNLSEEDRVQLRGLVMPISELLRELENRLLEYGSLGRKTSGSICDQIGWAWNGGGTVFERRIDSHIISLNLFLNGSVHYLELSKEWSCLTHSQHCFCTTKFRGGK